MTDYLSLCRRLAAALVLTLLVPSSVPAQLLEPGVFFLPSSTVPDLGTHPQAVDALPRTEVNRPDDVGGSQTKLVYVLPSDGIDRQFDINGQIVTSITASQSWLSGQTGGKRLRLDTFGGLPDILFVRLARTDAQMRAFNAFVRDEIEKELTSRGFIESTKIYLVYYDGSSNFSCGGGAWPPTLPGRVAALYLKGEPPGFTPCSVNVLGGSATVPGYWEFSGVHELMHTLGFVATCAPNHVLSGHAGDSPRDLMWAGSQPWQPEILDLNRDDYYSHGRATCLDLLNNAYLDPGGPTITARPSTLRFGAVKLGAAGALTATTAAQEVTVTFSGGSGSWTASASVSWLQITGGTGTGDGRFTVTVVNPSNVIGGSASLTGTINLWASAAANSPLSIPVSLTVDQTGVSTASPFGTVDTPATGATVQGAIPVTGWALDDVGVKRVEVWRNCLEGIDRPRGACVSPAVGLAANYVFLGRAFLLAGARPDVETANPTYPLAYRAGWGFMLLTNALPHQILNTPEGGQGGYVLSSFAIDEENHAALLGTKTITVDNDHATVPFGAIDTPGQGATIPEASAPYNNVNAYPAFGWAMTQSGKCIDTTSTTAYKVFIDGVQRALTPGTNWTAGLNRSDLAAAYPGLCNSSNALAVYYINAAALGLTSGLHTISWDVTDSASQTVFGLGTRFFNIVTSGGDAPLPDARPVAVGDAALLTAASRHEYVQLASGRRLAFHLGGPVDAGYEKVGGELRRLPVGSTLDAAAGTLAWEPPIGYFGTFELVFVPPCSAGLQACPSIDVTVTIVNPTSQPAAVAMHVDTPTDGAIVNGVLTVAGWALDPSFTGAGAPPPARTDADARPRLSMASGSHGRGRLATAGSGIDAVHVWAVRRDVPGFGPQFAGAATLSLARPDVAAAFGAQFSTAGFQLTTATLPPGTYEVTVYARRQSSGQWQAARTVTVTSR